MEKYPRLAKMGVLHPKQIIGYSISSIEYIDTLRIDYKRPEGSVLPVSRSYRFPRIQKEALTGANKDKKEVVMESDPAFHEAVAELRTITEAKEKTEYIAKEILAELTSLEEDTDMRIDAIKAMVSKIKAV